MFRSLYVPLHSFNIHALVSMALLLHGISSCGRSE